MIETLFYQPCVVTTCDINRQHPELNKAEVTSNKPRSVCSYGTDDRRIIVASPDWGPWGERSRNILSLDYYSCKSDNYATATANTMVVGRLLSFLVKKVQPDIADTLKTFCIGHSLGGHICGFAGKHYR